MYKSVMNKQEAQGFIDSQPGETIAQKETNALNTVRREEDLAIHNFYQTLNRLTEQERGAAKMLMYKVSRSQELEMYIRSLNHMETTELE